MRLFFFIVSIIITLSIKAQQPNFLINLKVNGLDTGYYKINFTEINSVTTSSIIYNDSLTKGKNTVQIKGFVPEERYVYLSIRRAGEFDFSIGPGDSATIILENMNFRDSYNITGSKRVVQSAEYINHIFRSQADELKRQKTRIDSLVIADAGIEKLQKAKKVSDSIYHANFLFNTNYADTASSAVASAMALNGYTKESGEYDILPNIERNIQRFGNLVTFQALMVAYRNKPAVKVLPKEKERINIDTVFSLNNAKKITKIVSKKRLVLIDFWASWCKPCIEEFPYLNDAYNSFKEKGFEVISVSLDKDVKLWKKARNRFSTQWNEHFIETDAMESKPAKSLGIKSIPRNYLIDKNGTVYAKSLRGTEIIEVLKKLL